MQDVSAEIERLTAERQALWCAGGDHGTEIARISSRLADLYEQKRQQAAQAASGRKRSEIVLRARVESELERLMTR